MRNAYWIPIGLAAGVIAGLPFGVDYMLAGAGIGLAGGVGVFSGLRIRAAQRSRRKSP